MRTIKKRSPPNSLTLWRAERLAMGRGPGRECSYDEMRRDPHVLEDVENGLFHEQGGLCAYTGIKILLSRDNQTSRAGFHIEHIRPQKHCNYGEDTEYTNLAACWPKPNCGFEPPFGAKKKDEWPSLQDESSFVSPLRHDCSERFVFTRKGEIAPARRNDCAVEITIQKLGLAHEDLVALRYGVIHGALNPKNRPINLKDAERLLKQIDQSCEAVDRGENVRLFEFCFAVRQALCKEIRKLESIKASRKKTLSR